MTVTTPDGTAAGELTIGAEGVRTGFAYRCDVLFPPSRLVLQSTEGVLAVGVPVPEGGGAALRRSMTPLALRGFDLSAPLRALLIPVGDPLPLPLDPSPAPPVSEEAPPEEATEDAPEEATEDTSEEVPEDTPEEATEDIPEAVPEPSPEPVSKPDSPAAPPPEWTPEPDPARYFTDPDLIASARRVTGALVRAEGEDALLAFPFSPSAPFPMLPAFRFGSAQEIDGRSYLVFRVREGVPL